MARGRRFGNGSYRQNVGRAGVVYVLENEGLRAGWYKIGCSTRTGRHRAIELNIQAGTGTPGVFKCVFEHRTRDCGKAEREVFHALRQHRRGKSGQEFFEVDVEHAKLTIARVCLDVDSRTPEPAHVDPYPKIDPSPVDSGPSSPSGPSIAVPPWAIPRAPTPAPVSSKKSTGLWPWIIAGTIAMIWWNAVRPPAQPPARAPAPRAVTDPYAKFASRAPPPPRVVNPYEVGKSLSSTSSAQTAQTAYASHLDTPTSNQAKPVSGPQMPSNTAARIAIESEVRMLSQNERSSLESACSTERLFQGVAAYDACKRSQLVALKSAPRNLDFSDVSSAERESMDSACSSDRLFKGPAAYDVCLAGQLKMLRASPRKLDFSGVSIAERESMDSACSNDRLFHGAAAYDRCLGQQLEQLKSAPRNIDFSGASAVERQSMESACSHARLFDGAAAYDRCLAFQVQALSGVPHNLNLSSLSPTERDSIDSACSHDRLFNGAYAYDICLLRQLRSIGIGVQTHGPIGRP